MQGNQKVRQLSRCSRLVGSGCFMQLLWFQKVVSGLGMTSTHPEPEPEEQEDSMPDVPMRMCIRFRWRDMVRRAKRVAFLRRLWAALGQFLREVRRRGLEQAGPLR